MSPRFAARFEHFVAPARHSADLWRLFAGLFVCAVVYVVYATVLSVFVFGMFPGALASGVGQTPMAMFLLFLSFPGLALGPLVAVRLLHDREPLSLFGNLARIWPDFLAAAKITLVVQGALPVLWLIFNDIELNLNFGTWLLLLPLSLAGVAIQTLSEELVFRGYVMQQLAARFASPLVWGFAPSLIFGLLHYSPETYGESAWLLVAAIVVFGLIAADLTAVTGNLGAAWGLHFANNSVALLLLSADGELAGLALYSTPAASGDIGWSMVLDALFLLGSWYLIRRRLAG